MRSSRFACAVRLRGLPPASPLRAALSPAGLLAPAARSRAVLVPLYGVGHHGLGMLGLGSGELDRAARLGSSLIRPASNAHEYGCERCAARMWCKKPSVLAHSDSTRTASTQSGRLQG